MLNRKFINFMLLNGLYFCCVGIVLATTNIDFENQTPGATINTIEADGIQLTFTSNITDQGLDLVISNQFDAVSGSTYLGINDAGKQLFIAGDRIDIQFDLPVDAVTVSFITGSGTHSGDLEITNGNTSVFYSILTDFIGTNEVYTFDISGVAAFSQVSLIATVCFAGDEMVCFQSYRVSQL